MIPPHGSPKNEADPTTPDPGFASVVGDLLLRPGPGASPKAGRTREEMIRARERQRAYLQRRRQHKRLRVFYGRLRIAVKLAFALLLGIILWEFAQAPFWTCPATTGVTVNGSLGLLQPRDFNVLSMRVAGQPVYRLDPRRIEKTLQAELPAIDRLYVRRALFPPRLGLTVVEKTPWAKVYASPRARLPYALMTDDYGFVPLKPEQRRHPELSDPALVNLLLPPRRRVSRTFLESLDRLAEQARSVSGLRLTVVDALHPARITLHFDGLRDRLRVKIGRLDATASDRLARLALLVPEIRKLAGTIDAVDLRWQSQVTFHRKSVPDKTPWEKNRGV